MITAKIYDNGTKLFDLGFVMKSSSNIFLFIVILVYLNQNGNQPFYDSFPDTYHISVLIQMFHNQLLADIANNALIDSKV